VDTQEDFDEEFGDDQEEPDLFELLLPSLMMGMMVNVIASNAGGFAELAKKIKEVVKEGEE
jgi:hypothetical protein